MAWEGSDAFSWSRFSQGAWVNAGALGDWSPYIGTTEEAPQPLFGKYTGVTSRTLDLTDGSPRPRYFHRRLDPRPTNCGPSRASTVWRSSCPEQSTTTPKRFPSAGRKARAGRTPQPLASAQQKSPTSPPIATNRATSSSFGARTTRSGRGSTSAQSNKWIPAHLVATTTSYAGIRRPTSLRAMPSLPWTAQRDGGLLVGDLPSRRRLGPGVGDPPRQPRKYDGAQRRLRRQRARRLAARAQIPSLCPRRRLAGACVARCQRRQEPMFSAAGAPDGSVLVVANDSTQTRTARPWRSASSDGASNAGLVQARRAELAPTSRSRISLTSFGFAEPFVSFITCPTRNPTMPFFPARMLATCDGCAAMTRAQTDLELARVGDDFHAALFDDFARAALACFRSRRRPPSPACR